MGQKVNPIGLRIGITKDWRSKWFADKKGYADILHEDIKLRKYIKKKLAFAGVPKIMIERATDKMRIIIFTARPGIVIGRRGADIEKLREELVELTGNKTTVDIDIKEVGAPEMNAQLVAENIAVQLERRISFRRAMKKAVSSAIDRGAGGIKVLCAGRLGGSEIARTEGYKEGKIPLHTLRADIDYGFTEARTTYGTIGVKVWIFKGESLPGGKEKHDGADAKKSEI